MKFEVELKFPVNDLRRVETALADLGAAIEIPVKQSDFYYGHPARDFAQTDEALRIRRVGSKNIITYKGPKIDATTKTRREIEVPLVSGAEGAANIIDMIEALGFLQVAEVTKNRRKANLSFADQAVEVALDEVKGLGEFVELEISTNEDGVDAAREAINQLAEKLGLSGSERRSYLELILES
ncbi:class IV adenylate cyclase [Blastopirellula marina]|uniref:Adenylyl cyclase related protein n=1 Tax=Blastopirellula marina DSM 3645 TaxID=314230 RepID=A3ZTE3_9BACT|nr:class IV adenylate cyclase [Blastopirellula marina]EAQ80202.1 adenylyl cyclase related protein [Blastopirellula marina DSM 3645]